MHNLRKKFESDVELSSSKNHLGVKSGLSTGNKMTQHFAKIHEPQKSEVLNVQQIQTPVGKVTKSRTSSTFSEKDPSGHIKTIKFIEKEKYQTENGEENNFDDKSQQFTQNVGQEIAKKLTHLGSSGKITVSSKIIKNGEVTTLTKVTNFGPKYIIPSKIQSPILAAGENIKPSSNSTPKTKLMHSPSTIKDLLLKWCRDKTIGYPNVEITNFSRSWANGLAFCALIHSYFPDAFDFKSLEIKNRQNNLDLAFKTAEEKADIFPLLEVEDMIEMKDSPDWKCVFTYVQSLYKGLKDKKHLNPFDQRIRNENINYEGTNNKEIGVLL